MVVFEIRLTITGDLIFDGEVWWPIGNMACRLARSVCTASVNVSDLLLKISTLDGQNLLCQRLLPFRQQTNLVIPCGKS